MKMMKRTLAILLVLILTCSMSATSVFADDGYTPTNSYVLNYNGVYEGSKWQYFSPYWASWKYDGSSDNEALISFTLYDTANEERFYTYCTDIATGLDADSNFRRINLEDSTYAGAAAGVLRSIVLKGFPNVSVEALGAAAGVEGLTVGEAVSATQAAIWQTAHGSRVEFTDFCYFIDTEWNVNGTEHYTECNAEIVSGYATAKNEALIESHIQAVFNYLTSLAPTAPAGIAVSNNSFVSWSDAPVLEKNEDGTYSVTVKATVDVEMNGGDALTLTAVLGAYSASASLENGENTKTLTIAGVPADQIHNDVILNIDGQQTVSDVFLFDAVGERGTSQSLIGMNDSQLPVHAEVVVQAERIINFYKTSKVATGTDENGNATYKRVPLEGIAFDLYLAGTMEEYESGAIDLDYSYYGQADYTVTTDEDGRASVSLTKNDLPDGVYLVVERSHAAIEKPVDAFYVVVPATNESGTGWVYEINIEPKNEVKGKVEIGKDVIELGNDSSSVNAQEPFTWIISADIPHDLANGKTYVISDTLDNRLDYASNLKVQVESIAAQKDEASTEGEETTESEASIKVLVELKEGTDYYLVVTDNDSLAEDKPSDSFAVSLTAKGMQKIANAVGANNDAYKIRVYFDAKINSNAEMGTEIPNKATLEYRNSVGYDFSVESDKPVVQTGGINLVKVDAATPSTKLEGAVFQVYRNATEAEVADENIDKITLGDMSAPMVLVSFYNNADLSGEPVTSVTSGEDGSFGVYGLAYGTYYLVETQAPAGYNLSSVPIEVTINGTSHQMENIIQVTNNAGATLPETGGIGTTIFYVVGGVLLVGAVVLLITKKRMSAEG